MGDFSIWVNTSPYKSCDCKCYAQTTLFGRETFDSEVYNATKRIGLSVHMSYEVESINKLINV